MHRVTQAPPPLANSEAQVSKETQKKNPSPRPRSHFRWLRWRWRSRWPRSGPPWRRCGRASLGLHARGRGKLFYSEVHVKSHQQHFYVGMFAQLYLRYGNKVCQTSFSAYPHHCAILGQSKEYTILHYVRMYCTQMKFGVPFESKRHNFFVKFCWNLSKSIIECIAKAVNKKI